MLKPMGQFLLTQLVKDEPLKKGLLIMPDEEKEYKTVEVLDFSINCVHWQKYEKKMKFIIGRYNGRAIQHKGKDYLLVDEKELLAEVV